MADGEVPGFYASLQSFPPGPRPITWVETGTLNPEAVLDAIGRMDEAQRKRLMNIILGLPLPAPVPHRPEA